MSLRRSPAERSVPALLTFGLVALDKPPGPSSHEVSGWVRDAMDDALARAAANGRIESVDTVDPVDSIDANDRADPDDGKGAIDRATPSPGGDSDGAGDSNDGPVTAEEGATRPERHPSRPRVDRAAHGGTLDPKVTGVLPLFTGTATRLSRVHLEGDKEYVAVLECHGPVPDDATAVLERFEGPIYQRPPRHSAVARRRRVRTIYALEDLERDERRLLLSVSCERGTYVRKLCHDLGLALGTGAHMGELRRTATGAITDADLVTLHDLVDALEWWVEDGDEGPIREVVRPAERALEGLPSVTIDRAAAREVAHGAPVYAPGVRSVEDAEVDDLVACFTPDGAAVCLGRLVADPALDAGTVVSLERVLV